MNHSPQEIGKLYRSAPRGQHSPQEIGKLYREAPQQSGGCFMALVFWGLVAFGLWLKFGGGASIVTTVKEWVALWPF